MAFTAQRFYSFPIAEITKSDDGDFEIVGVATDGSIDADQQIVDPRWAGPPGYAIQKWLSTGANVRVMHNPQRDPAGIGVKAWTDDNGATWVRSRIVEPVAQKLIRSSALRAYSIGISNPRIVGDRQAKGGRIVGGEVTELTVCDRPSNGSCGITICKSVNGRAAYVGKVFGAGQVAKVKVPKVGKAARRELAASDLFSSDPAIREAAYLEAMRSPAGAKAAKAAQKLWAHPAKAAAKAIRVQMHAALDSADPWEREIARRVLGG